MLTSVLGERAAQELTHVLMAEVLMARPERRPGNAGLPATAAALGRASVTIEHLGQLMMGARNVDDRSIGYEDALAGLVKLVSETTLGGDPAKSPAIGATGVAVVTLADRYPGATADELAMLSRNSGVSIVRGTNGVNGETAGDPELIAAAIQADLTHGEHPAGIVGSIPLPVSDRDEATVQRAAEAARATGSTLVFAAATELRQVTRGLVATDRAGLARERIAVTGAAALIAARQSNGKLSVGIDPERLRELEDLGTAICFDDIGRIPTVLTSVSDHDVAVTILDLASRGSTERILLSCGIRNKHRLAAFGGNGFEFIAQQFLPHLRRLGAEEATIQAISGRNAARLLMRATPRVERGRHD